jgi:hypothetical protein
MKRCGTLAIRFAYGCQRLPARQIKYRLMPLIWRKQKQDQANTIFHYFKAGNQSWTVQLNMALSHAATNHFNVWADRTVKTIRERRIHLLRSVTHAFPPKHRVLENVARYDPILGTQKIVGQTQPTVRQSGKLAITTNSRGRYTRSKAISIINSPEAMIAASNKQRPATSPSPLSYSLAKSLMRKQVPQNRYAPIILPTAPTIELHEYDSAEATNHIIKRRRLSVHSSMMIMDDPAANEQPLVHTKTMMKKDLFVPTFKAANNFSYKHMTNVAKQNSPVERIWQNQNADKGNASQAPAFESLGPNSASPCINTSRSPVSPIASSPTQSMMPDVAKLTDEVISRIERHMRNEQQRRGIWA